MSATIFKYRLQPPTDDKCVVSVTAPYDFTPLSVHVQYGEIMVWGAVIHEARQGAPRSPAAAPTRAERLHRFLVVPTGAEVDLRFYRFLGTVLLRDGTLVFHVFYQSRAR